ncbi:MAG: glycosyltransferase family 39 protein [Candidatus Omnitrophota bacterium]
MHELPSYGDEAYHLIRSLDYLDILKHPHKGIPFALLGVDNLRPPFFHLFMAFANIIWGKTRLVSIMSNIFFAAVLFFSIYYIGKKIKDRNTGLLAAFTTAMYPYVFGLSRMSLPNFTSSAFVCLSLCCLLYTDRFKRIVPSILFGLFLGFGLLTRLTFVFFVIGPTITVVITALIEKQTVAIRKRIILNICLAIVIATALGGIWYFPRLAKLIRHYIGQGFAYSLPICPEIFSFSWLTFYFRSLLDGQLSPFFVILFFTGLLGILKSKEKINPVIFSWIIVTYIIFTLITTKMAKYTSEYLAAFAIITALGISRYQTKWLRVILIYLIILGGLLQYFVISYTNPALTNIRISLSNGEMKNNLRSPSYLDPITEVFFHYPRRGDWKLEEVISLIRKEGSSGKDITIGVTDACIEIKTDWFDPSKLSIYWHDNFIISNLDTINYYLKLKGIDYTILSLSRTQENWKQFPFLDFIISVEPIENFAFAISSQYRLILQTKVSDGSLVYVSKRFDSG